MISFIADDDGRLATIGVHDPPALEIFEFFFLKGKEEGGVARFHRRPSWLMKNRDSLNSKSVRVDYFGMDGTLIYYIVVYCSAVFDRLGVSRDGSTFEGVVTSARQS